MYYFLKMYLFLLSFQLYTGETVHGETMVKSFRVTKTFWKGARVKNQPKTHVWKRTRDGANITRQPNKAALTRHAAPPQPAPVYDSKYSYPCSDLSAEWAWPERGDVSYGLSASESHHVPFSLLHKQKPVWVYAIQNKSPNGKSCLGFKISRDIIMNSTVITWTPVVSFRLRPVFMLMRYSD